LNNEKKKKNKSHLVPASYFNIGKQRPLSKLTVATLLKACIKQQKGIKFGQLTVHFPPW
jgi:hypothetical protein